MGQEIDSTRFKKSDFDAFNSRLKQETELLSQWFSENKFDNQQYIAGFELEAWLVDKNYQPAPLNEEYLAHANNSLISPELAIFNIELNGNPLVFGADTLNKLHKELEQTWQQCEQTACELNIMLAMIGILPTVDDKALTLDNMSKMKRYKALNEQVLRLRKGKPLNLDILGHQHLKTEHNKIPGDTDDLMT